MNNKIFSDQVPGLNWDACATHRFIGQQAYYKPPPQRHSTGFMEFVSGSGHFCPVGFGYRAI